MAIVGQHQVANASLAIMALLLQKIILKVTPELIKNARSMPIGEVEQSFEDLIS